MSYELYRVKWGFRGFVDRDGNEGSRGEDTVMVAVHPDFGSDPVTRAVDLAIERRIGSGAVVEEYQIFVQSVEAMGSVYVEPRP